VYRGVVIFRHFVFDLDGTLIDSRQDLADAANAMLASYEAPPLPVPVIVGMVGEGARLLVERVVARAGVACDVDTALDRFLTAYDQCLVAQTRPYAGVDAMLEALGDMGARLSVLTNKPQGATERVLAGLGLAGHFHTVIGGDTGHGRKPGPEGLHALIAGSGVPAGATVMVGDSWVDVATAAAAGIDACLVSYGFGYAAACEPSRPVARWTAATPAEVTALAHGQTPAASTPRAIPG
jgi:phosphoglycolate phosphatase